MKNYKISDIRPGHDLLLFTRNKGIRVKAIFDRSNYIFGFLLHKFNEIYEKLR